MTATEKTILKKASRGRPKTDSTPVLVRLPPDILSRLDSFIATKHPDLSRPEAIRSILQATLDMMSKGEDQA